MLTPEPDNDTDESPPGGIELQLPLGAIPGLLNLIPAIPKVIGVLRLPEALAGIDLARIATPRMEQYARLEQSVRALAPVVAQANAVDLLAPQMERMNALMQQALASVVARSTADLMGGFGQIEAALVSLRSLGMQLDIFRVATGYEKWAAANPCWPLVLDVGLERDGWETSLNTLAALPEFALVIEAVRQRGLDAYAATLTVRWVLKQVIQDLRNIRSSDMPPALLPYLQKAVQNALSGQRRLSLPEWALLGTGKKRGGGPTPTWLTEDECRAAVVKAIRYQLGRRSANLQKGVAEQLGFTVSGLGKALRRVHLDWRELVQEAKTRR